MIRRITLTISTNKKRLVSWSNVKHLKDELLKLTRVEKRQDLNVEYLKNVVLTFLEAETDEQREPLLVVVGQVLQLSPEELERLRKSATGEMASAGLLEGWFS
jgi:hypothetical protein